MAKYIEGLRKSHLVAANKSALIVLLGIGSIVSVGSADPVRGVCGGVLGTMRQGVRVDRTHILIGRTLHE